MSMITKSQEVDLSGDIEDIYGTAVDRILSNIARHMWSSAPSTQMWEINRLAETDQITAETAAIIRKETKNAPKKVKASIEKAIQYSMNGIEPKLNKAAKDGYLTMPMTDVLSSPRMQKLVKTLLNQATDKLNLTNTTMLESSVRAYKDAVSGTVKLVQVAQEKAVKTALNEAVALDRMGVETRRQAISEVLTSMADNGIAGLVDSAGREWTPEAYVSMNIRSTIHRSAAESVFERMADYDDDIIQCSTHPDSRPEHFDYQGKYFSLSGMSGTFTDGNGVEHEYESIENTDDWEGPTSLFTGINCQHEALPVIPGVSTPAFVPDDADQTEAENNEGYDLKQEQRSLERDIRAAKREQLVQQTGTDAYKAASAKVSDAQARIREFTKANDLTRNYGREQIK